MAANRIPVSKSQLGWPVLTSVLVCEWSCVLGYIQSANNALFGGYILDLDTHQRSVVNISILIPNISGNIWEHLGLAWVFFSFPGFLGKQEEGGWRHLSKKWDHVLGKFASSKVESARILSFDLSSVRFLAMLALGSAWILWFFFLLNWFCWASNIAHPCLLVWLRFSSFALFVFSQRNTGLCGSAETLWSAVGSVGLVASA